MRFIFLLTTLAATPVLATDVVRLPDAQRDAVIAAAANGPEKPAVYTPEQAQQQSVLDRSLYPEFFARGPADAGTAAPDRKVHGEMTMFAGSGGTVGMSGTAVVPVGEHGTAAISVMQGTSRYGSVQGFGFGFSTGGAGNSVALNGGFGSPFGYGYGGFGYLLTGFGYPPGYPYGYGMMGWGGPGRFRQHW